MENRDLEVWKPIKDYQGFYEVSSWGNVKSLSRIIKHSRKGLILVQGKVLALHIRGTYQFVNLYRDNIRSAKNVNVLVAMAFLEDYSEDKIVNHLDKNKLNNYYKNLECIYSRENVTFSIDKEISASRLVGAHVSFVKINGKTYKRITSEIYINKKKIWLGSFKSEEDAHQAYLDALKKYGVENKYAIQS